MRARVLGAVAAAVLGLTPAADLAAPPAPEPSTWLRPAVLGGPQLLRAATFAAPPTPAQCRAAGGELCLMPRQVQAAYGVDRLLGTGTTGRGRTVCVVDSFGSPTVREDLALFSRTFDLPPADLQVVSPAGPVRAYDGSADRAGWAAETSLDVQWAHALAPQARLLLITTPTSETEGIHGFPEIARAVRFAVDHYSCDVISQSYGASEATFDSRGQVLALRDRMFVPAARRGITLLAAAGDTGATDYQLDGVHLLPGLANSWPSVDPLVTSVGGTRLRVDDAGRRMQADAVWGGQAGTDATGGGRSALFTRPAFQDSVRDVVGSRRGTPDVAMVAAPESALVVAESFDRRRTADSGPWHLEAGTSAATPVLAGVVALACQQAGGRVGALNPLLYGPLARGSGLVDVTRGRSDLVDHAGPDGSVTSRRGWAAVPGYDLASGLGTVDAARLVPAIAALVRGAPMSPQVLVCVPTYNERENLPLVLRRLRAAVPEADVLVVDDGSPDGTGAVADALAAADSSVHVLHRTEKVGLGAAYVAAFTWGLERGYDVLVEMDADGSHQPEELPRLLHAVAGGADLVLGSRYVPGGEVRDWPASRLLLSKGGNTYTRIVLGLPVRDATGGYRAYRADALRAVGLDGVDSQGYCFQVDLVWRVWQQGLTVVEVPITFVERQVGASKMSRAIVAEALWRVTVWGARSVRTRRRPPAPRA